MKCINYVQKCVTKSKIKICKKHKIKGNQNINKWEKQGCGAGNRGVWRNALGSTKAQRGVVVLVFQEGVVFLGQYGVLLANLWVRGDERPNKRMVQGVLSE